MTTLELRLKLRGALQPSEFEKLSRLSTVYGILKMRTEGQDLFLEYDATRMNEADVLSLIRGAGLAADPAG